MIKDVPDLVVKNYPGNPRLKAADFKMGFTKQQLAEYVKCSNDPLYFIERYVKIVHVDKGLIPFKMWKFQKEMITTIHENRFFIGKLSRQVGKSTLSVAYILHYILFNDDKNVGILANKAATSREILSRLKLAYENLPFWMQSGVVEWNKGSIKLGNGSAVQAAACSSSSVRGQSFSMIFLDEFAFVPQNIAEEFFTSTYPTISSGRETRVIIVSTPKGMNHFYKFWVDATEKRSEFVPFRIDWWDVPGRDEKWKLQQVANLGSEEAFDQEFGGEFIGSSGTLINGRTLASLVFKTPLFVSSDTKVFVKPEPNRFYAITCDAGEGTGHDYTVAHVIDITNYPFQQVAVFRSNKTQPLQMPDVLYTLSKSYNNAYVLIETNSSGRQIADTLQFEYDLENLLFVGQGKRGQLLMSGSTPIPGLRTTKQTKRIGCSNLKSLIENGRLIINDIETITELSTFSRVRDTFAAEPNKNDDTVMALVVFAWMTTQIFFEEMAKVNQGIRQEIFSNFLQQYDEDLLPAIGSNALEKTDEEFFIDKDGIVWAG